jgi:hypothetical protein
MHWINKSQSLILSRRRVSGVRQRLVKDTCGFIEFRDIEPYQISGINKCVRANGPSKSAPVADAYLHLMLRSSRRDGILQQG